MLRQLFNGLRAAGCSEHDYGNWESVNADPEYRLLCNKMTGRGDWRTYSYPCTDFRRCGNCNHIDTRTEHAWGSPETITTTTLASVDDTVGNSSPRQIRRCIRSDCYESRPA